MAGVRFPFFILQKLEIDPDDFFVRFDHFDEIIHLVAAIGDLSSIDRLGVIVKGDAGDMEKTKPENGILADSLIEAFGPFEFGSQDFPAGDRGVNRKRGIDDAGGEHFV